MKITRVRTPAWARKPSIENEDLPDEVFVRLLGAHEAILAAVHTEVSEYISDPNLTFDSPDEFPSTQRLTGEYHIERENYYTAPETGICRVTVMTHFLEHPMHGDSDPGNYLGLEVWLECDPADLQFSVFRNTDSSSI